MEIDNHILSLSMEFEKQNIIINEFETQKAKNAHDRSWRKRKKSAKEATAEKSDEEEAYEGDKEESGFEDNGSATNDDEEDEEDPDQTKDDVSITSSKREEDSDEEEEEDQEPEEVRQAWDELLLIQREQQRYSDIKYDLEQDLERCKKKQIRLEDVSFLNVWRVLETF